MNNPFHLQDLFVFLGCAATGCGFAWLLYGKTRHLSKGLKWGMSTLRAIVMTLVLWLIFAPLIKSISYVLEKPLILIGQDNSLSVGHTSAKGFNAREYQQDLQDLAKTLSEKYDVRVYHFSDSVKNGFDFSNKGKWTDVSALTGKLNDEFINRNVGAVILATDGIFNKGGSPLSDLDKLKAPVYTIALGDTVPRKDVLVANINYNNLVYLDHEFTAEVQVQAFESKGEKTVLSVFENGKKIQEQTISVTSNVFVKDLSLKLKAAKLGAQKYTISLTKLSNEVSELNNSRTFVVDVIDNRQKILLAAASPHPDIAALKQAIEANKYFEVKVALDQELNQLNPIDYGLIIFYQLPALQSGALPLLKKVQSMKIPLWFIAGAQTDITSFNQVQKLVQLDPPGGNVKEVFAVLNPEMAAFNLEESSKKAIGTYDPLLSPSLKTQLNGPASTILYQKSGRSENTVPLLFFMNTNGLRTAYLMGEGIWRWRLADAKNQQPEIFSRLMTGVVQYLSIKDNKNKFRVYPVKKSFEENENVLFNAELYNDSQQAVTGPDVSIQLKNEQGKAYQFVFSKLTQAYQLDAGMLPPGMYTYTAQCSYDHKKYTEKGSFYVNAILAEFQQSMANHQILYTLSTSSGGKMYLPQDIKSLLKEVEKNEKIKTLSYEDRNYQELINFKWLFVLLLVLLTAEWMIRKRNGLQ